jgi:hypothetical protein
MVNNVKALSLNPETILLDSFLGIPVILIIANIILMLLFVVISKFFQYLGVKKSKSVKGGFIKSVFINRDVK